MHKNGEEPSAVVLFDLQTAHGSPTILYLRSHTFNQQRLPSPPVSLQTHRQGYNTKLAPWTTILTPRASSPTPHRQMQGRIDVYVIGPRMPFSLAKLECGTLMREKRSGLRGRGDREGLKPGGWTVTLVTGHMTAPMQATRPDLPAHTILRGLLLRAVTALVDNGRREWCHAVMEAAKSRITTSVCSRDPSRILLGRSVVPWSRKPWQSLAPCSQITPGCPLPD